MKAGLNEGGGPAGGGGRGGSDACGCGAVDEAGGWVVLRPGGGG